MNDFYAAHFSDGAKQSSRKRGWADRWVLEVLRMRFQIGMGLFLATIFPILVLGYRQRAWPAFPPDLTTTLLGMVLGFLIGFVIFRKLTAFPGVRANAHVMPAFAAGYLVVAALFAALRAEFSRTELAFSFVCVTTFFYLAFLSLQRLKPPSFSVVPMGDLSSLTLVSGVNFRLLPRSDEMPADDSAIVADLNGELSPEWERFIAEAALQGRTVYNVKDVMESVSGRVLIDHISENTFGALSLSTIYGPLKRYLDFVGALVFLLLAWPFLLLIAVIVRLESPGSAIFRQERIGFRGAAFTVYKFRSMRTLAPGENGDPRLGHDAKRITPFGRFIRRTRIDELPQVINILRGEMSWIGPRPEARELSELYESRIPFYRYRHIVRPGLTGWAQVNQGHVVGVEEADVKLQYDFFYVKHFSLWLDALVALRTVRVLLGGSGSR